MPPLFASSSCNHRFAQPFTILWTSLTTAAPMECRNAACRGGAIAR